MKIQKEFSDNSFCNHMLIFLCDNKLTTMQLQEEICIIVQKNKSAPSLWKFHNMLTI